MPHGGPDWGTIGPLATVYTLEDMAELAARLGSIVTFDRRGNITFLENFDGSLAKCYSGSDGVGGGVSISNERARHGNFSCKLVTGNVIDDEAWVGTLLAYPTLSKMGIEVAWSLPTGCNIKAFFLLLDIIDGTMSYYASVRWLASDGTWYYDDGSGWVALSPTVDYYEGATQFNHIKLVGDFVNKKYVRLIANNLVYDLSDKALGSEESDEMPTVECEVGISTRANAVSTVFVDSMLITQNEP